MAFRLVIAGDRRYAALDELLGNRLPDVELPALSERDFTAELCEQWRHADHDPAELETPKTEADQVTAGFIGGAEAGQKDVRAIAWRIADALGNFVPVMPRAPTRKRREAAGEHRPSLR
jgi:hypothetical protein